MRPQDSHSFPHTDSRRAAPRGALRLRIVLLATSALVSAALSTTVAHAGDATWSARPADGDFNNGLNWSGGVSPDGTATFGTSTRADVSFTQTTTLDGITVNAGRYAFTNKAGLALTFNGAGFPSEAVRASSSSTTAALTS